MKNLIFILSLSTTGLAHADWSGSMLVKSLKCAAERQPILEMNGKLDQDGGYSATIKKVIGDKEITGPASATVVDIQTMSEPPLSIEFAGLSRHTCPMRNDFIILHSIR